MEPNISIFNHQYGIFPWGNRRMDDHTEISLSWLSEVSFLFLYFIFIWILFYNQNIFAAPMKSGFVPDFVINAK